jgi:CRISPR-associated protein, Csd1 family
MSMASTRSPSITRTSPPEPIYTLIDKTSKIAPKDVVTFAIDRGIPELYPFEREPVRQFWVKHLEQEFVSSLQGQCASCGQVTRLLQTLPQEVVLPGQKCQITSFNREAFKHFGKDQTLNAPLCWVIVIFGEVGLLEYREALTLRGRRNSSGSMEC